MRPKTYPDGIVKKVVDGLVILEYPDGSKLEWTPHSCKRAEHLSDTIKEKVYELLIRESRHDYSYEKERDSLALTTLLRVSKILDYWECPNMIEYMVKQQKRGTRTRAREYLKKNGVKF